MANVVTDPYSGLQFVELSHVWDHGGPSYPGDPDVRMVRGVKHAQHGVLAWRITTVLNTGTHMNAPWLTSRRAPISPISIRRLSSATAWSWISQEELEKITCDDLKAASPAIEKGDIVVICTGWHAKYSDGLEYFGEAPGLTKDAAQYLVQAGAKMVAVDTPFVDLPLATHMGPQRGGPQMKRLADAYKAATGRDAKQAILSGIPRPAHYSRPASLSSSRSVATSTRSKAVGRPSLLFLGSSSMAKPARCA